MLSARFVNEKLNPKKKNIGLIPISSAAAACADVDARLPLPVNDDQTRLYRAIFDELGANGTVALRLKSGFMDIDSGEAPSYNKLNDPKQFVGMAATADEEAEWKSHSKDEKVFTVCEKTSYQAIEQSGNEHSRSC